MKTSIVIAVIVVVVGGVSATVLLAPQWKQLQEVSSVCDKTKPKDRSPEQQKLCKVGSPPFGGIIIPGLL